MGDVPSVASLRVIADLAGLKLDRVYRLMRLPQSPPPCAHPGCVPVYDVSVVLAYLRGDAGV